MRLCVCKCKRWMLGPKWIIPVVEFSPHIHLCIFITRIYWFPAHRPPFHEHMHCLFSVLSNYRHTSVIKIISCQRTIGCLRQILSVLEEEFSKQASIGFQRQNLSLTLTNFVGVVLIGKLWQICHSQLRIVFSQLILPSVKSLRRHNRKGHTQLCTTIKDWMCWIQNPL